MEICEDVSRLFEMLDKFGTQKMRGKIGLGSMQLACLSIEFLCLGTDACAAARNTCA